MLHELLLVCLKQSDLLWMHGRLLHGLGMGKPGDSREEWMLSWGHLILLKLTLKMLLILLHLLLLLLKIL